MSLRERPQLIVVAGPNGSGKSTLTRTLLAPTGIPILDPDAVARDLSQAAPEQMRLEAGRVVLQRQRDFMASGTSFVVETTLSGHTAVHLMAAAYRYGFIVKLIYVSTDNAEINIGRIAERVRQGGHQVPKPDVYRRYIRSLRKPYAGHSSLGYRVVLRQYRRSAGTGTHNQRRSGGCAGRAPSTLADDRAGFISGRIGFGQEAVEFSDDPGRPKRSIEPCHGHATLCNWRHNRSG